MHIDFVIWELYESHCKETELDQIYLILVVFK